MRFQVALPPQIEFCRLATQGIRPTCLRYVDGPRAIAAELAWETHQHEFLFSLLSRLTRLVQQSAPVFIGNMVVDQLCDPFSALLDAGATEFLLVLVLLVFMIRHQSTEVRNGRTRIGRRVRWCEWRGLLGGMLLVEKATIQPGKRPGQRSTSVDGG